MDAPLRREERVLLNRHRVIVALVVLAASVSSRARAQGAQPGPTGTSAPEPSTPPPAEAAPAAPSRAQQLRRLSDQFAALQARLEEQDANVKRLEERLRVREAVEASKPTGAPAGAQVSHNEPTEPGAAEAGASTAEGRETASDPRRKVLVYGYVQGQFQVDQSSQNVVAQSGGSLNQDRFLVPRARLVAEREWSIASALLEIDGNTVNGGSIGLQRAEASILYRGQNAPPLPPLLSVTIGQFRVPFGAENLQSSLHRYFMERSLVSRAMFPSEIDLGLRVAGAIGWFRYAVSATNGQPIGTRDFALGDPDSAKDVAGRLGVSVKPVAWAVVDAGVSSLVGRGFHQEAGGVKSQLQWVDSNGDGIFQADELTGVDAVAARPSSTFRRFALALDAQTTLRWRLGATQLGGALYLGNNVDRGVFVSDPVLLGRDTRHVGYMLSVLHELGDWVVVGLRMDTYNPDSDSSDFQNAIPVQPNDRTFRTWSPLVGLKYRERARLLFQYDAVRDKLGRDQAGLPVDLSNDRMTLRLQVSL